jgi:hypothetical protein
MRPTWHFVTPTDIRWLLELTAPRVDQVNRHMYRKVELDETLFQRSNTVITKALTGGIQLTRSELGAVLAQAGIIADGIRLSYLMMRAELDALICSGARRGKQFTYALLDERAPQARSLPHDQALAELVKRFFTSHGPATVADCAWWSGLTQADVKLGLALNAPDLIQNTFAGTPYWHTPAQLSIPPAIAIRQPTALLLPPYDEYAIAYKNHAAILDSSYAQQAGVAVFGGIMVFEGQIIGNWRRSITTSGVIVEYAPFRPLSTPEEQAFTHAARRFAAFLGLALV